MTREIKDEPRRRPAADLARGAMVWSQIFGLVGFEAFGQFANGFDPADEFYAYSVERMAGFLGLPADTDR